MLSTIALTADGRTFPTRLATPEEVQGEALVKGRVARAEKEGAEIFVAMAGLAAHLPGVVASLTALPVIGVPLAAGQRVHLDASRDYHGSGLVPVCAVVNSECRVRSVEALQEGSIPKHLNLVIDAIRVNRKASRGPGSVPEIASVRSGKASCLHDV